MKEETNAAFQAVEFGPLWLIGKQTTIGQGKTATQFVKSFRTDGSMQMLQASSKPKWWNRLITAHFQHGV